MPETQEPLVRLRSSVRGMVLADETIVAAIGELVRGVMSDGAGEVPEAAKEALSGAGPVYVELRSGGELLHSGWGEGDDHGAALIDAVNAARGSGQAGDTVLVCLCFDFQTVDMGDERARRRLIANRDRGMRGIQLRAGEKVDRFCQLMAVQTNRKPEKLLDAFRQEHRLSMKDMSSDAVSVQTFDAAQIMVPLEAQRAPLPLIRGKRYFPIEKVTRENVQMLERELGDFMVRSTQSDGRMMYMYYPSRGTEDQKRQNMIRQWMATLSLCRLGTYRKDSKIHAVAEKNIRYNLRKFYHASGKLGLIEWNKKVKLGALALAILSLYEHPKRKQFKRQEQRMRATLDYLWQDTGEFRTFFKPADRNDVQNFYPGEAQLCWAFLWCENKDDDLLDRFMKSFRYYREWHFVEKNRNPAFIPWHAQAYYNVWLHTQDEELKTVRVRDERLVAGRSAMGRRTARRCPGTFPRPQSSIRAAARVVDRCLHGGLDRCLLHGAAGRGQRAAREVPAFDHSRPAQREPAHVPRRDQHVVRAKARSPARGRTDDRLRQHRSNRQHPAQSDGDSEDPRRVRRGRLSSLSGTPRGRTGPGWGGETAGGPARHRFKRRAEPSM